MAPTGVICISHHARLSSYIAVTRRGFSLCSSKCSSSSSSQFHRSDFTNQPFTGTYEPGLPTSGPLGGASIHGALRLTPKMLKQHLDQFVVGQDRAKKILSVAVYNHYQRIQELQRQEEEEEELLAQRERRERHSVQDGQFPNQQPTIRLGGPPTREYDDGFKTPRLLDTTPLTLEKSNIMLLGPSGVGKTLMAKTLARVLSVPFSMSDCTPFTQAGYIGEDAEVCVHRLLAAANYDVTRAERGIICLDEIDKIATAKVSHGKDVSGEGVQQALLKIIEGTTIQIQAKSERNASRPSSAQSSPFNTSSPLGGSSSGSGSSSSYASPSTTASSSSSNSSTPPSKGEVYNVRTDNILFIFSGAFIGLPKTIMDRLSKSSIGFGAPVRSSSSLFYNNPTTSSSLSSKEGLSNEAIPILPGSEEEALYKKHLPFFTPTPTPPDPETSSSSSDPSNPLPEPTYFNPLELLIPTDLQTYGLIPELIGRIPTTAALSPLSHSLLLRILTEPRSSLTAQYTTLFSLSSIELRFTTPALHVIASNALAMSTAGARALRTDIEAILGDAMFEAPGSSVKYVLVTERVARREEPVVYFGRGQGGRFHAWIAREEGDWEDKVRREREARMKKASGSGTGTGTRTGTRSKRKNGDEPQGGGGVGGGNSATSFEEWRGRSSALGAGAG